MRKVLLVIVALLPLAVAARQGVAVPDNEAIQKQIVDASSPYYYPQLMDRYRKGDRTLTAADYHYLYYGYAFQDTYSPLDPQPAMDDILMEIDRSPEPDSLQCARILSFAKQAMETDPFNPRCVNMAAFAHAMLGDTLAARTYAIRVEKILETIKASGTGQSERSPWAALSFSHIDALLGSMELQARRRIIVSSKVEYVEVARNDQGIKGIYFDFSRAYSVKPGRAQEPRRQGMEINSIKIR